MKLKSFSMLPTIVFLLLGILVFFILIYIGIIGTEAERDIRRDFCEEQGMVYRWETGPKEFCLNISNGQILERHSLIKIDKEFYLEKIDG